MNSLKNQRGFMLLNVIILTLITSFVAMILLNAAPRIKNPQAAIRLTAIHLANEKFALIESKAASGVFDLNCPINSEDLTTENFSEGNQIEFTVSTTDNPSGNLHRVTVKVEWTVEGRKDFVEVERTIRVVE